MNEQTEPQRTGARARALLGGAAAGAGGNTESAGGGSGPPNATDVALIAARIQYYSNLSAEEARAIAAQLTEQARVAVTKLLGGATDTALSDDEVMSLESVIYVRSRPAVRIMGQQGDRLEGLEKHPGSELWQDFITDCEQRIISAARATGAAMVMALNTGAPELVRGSAWLVTPNRVITNRHVLQNRQMNMLVPADGGGKRIGDDYSLVIEFTFDNRKTMTKTRQRVTDVLYVSEPADPIDIAVLGIEGAGTPLAIASSATPTPKNLFVVGHPGLSMDVSAPVKAVFGNPDGRKRVSFGKFVTSGPTEFGHDASTIGGYSGGPVVGICDGVVAGLHYYGDPANGNLAISAAAIRAHAAFGHCQ